jgi:hypothetical protein
VGGAHVGDVHVDVPFAAGRGVDTHDDEAVAQRGEAVVQAFYGVLVAVGQEVLDLAARAGRRLVRQVLAGVVMAVLVATGQCGSGRLDAGHRRHQCVEDETETGPAGVDHAGFAEDRELVGRRLEGDTGAVRRRADDGGEIGAALVDGGDRGLGTGAGDGEEGALLGVGDRGVCGVCGLLHGGGEGRTVGRGLAAELVGQAAQELGEDRAGVAARTEDGAAGEDRPSRLGRAWALLVEGGDGGLRGQQEIGARVAVGHREDVEIVQPAT